MDWTYFHFFASLVALFIAYGWVKHPGRPQHIIGGHVLLWSGVASQLARSFAASPDPVMWYLVIDIGAIAILGHIMMTRKAIWAALIVLFHSGMILAHALYYMGEALSRYAYLTTLGILFFLSVLCVALGALAGRYAWGESLDRMVSHRFRPWSWSGVRFPRDPYFASQMG